MVEGGRILEDDVRLVEEVLHAEARPEVPELLRTILHRIVGIAHGLRNTGESGQPAWAWSHRSASSAAIVPKPAAVTAWR